MFLFESIQPFYCYEPSYRTSWPIKQLTPRQEHLCDSQRLKLAHLFTQHNYNKYSAEVHQQFTI